MLTDGGGILQHLMSSFNTSTVNKESIRSLPFWSDSWRHFITNGTKDIQHTTTVAKLNKLVMNRTDASPNTDTFLVDST